MILLASIVLASSVASAITCVENSIERSLPYSAIVVPGLRVDQLGVVVILMTGELVLVGQHDTLHSNDGTNQSGYSKQVFLAHPGQPPPARWVTIRSRSCGGRSATKGSIAYLTSFQ